MDNDVITLIEVAEVLHSSTIFKNQQNVGIMLENVNWDEGEICHNWRKHVPQEIKDCWNNLPCDAWYVVYIIAKRLAEDEEWN